MRSATAWLAVTGCSFSAPAPLADAGADVPGDVADGDSAPVVRVTEGLIGLWLFDDQGGAGGGVVTDTAGQLDPTQIPAVNPTIATPSSVTWSSDAMTINLVVEINTGFTTANRLIVSSKATNAVTLEAWVSPNNEIQAGTITGQPARIATFTQLNAGAHELSLGQIASTWVAEARTSNPGVDPQGSPMLVANDLVVTTTHLVVTADASGRRFFVNGTKRAEDSLGGSFDLWDNRHSLVIGGDPNAKNNWLGTYFLMAMYDRALTDAEVRQNFLATPAR